MKHKVTKAIFPVAGQGTRFLPATKSIPKEIMTLVDRPLVQYAIDEARAAGIKELHNLPLPEYPDDPPLSAGQIRQCFGEFLKFLKFNLAGQTALRVDGDWASQTQIIQGFANSQRHI